MPTTAVTEVPKDAWALFLDAFSRQHLGWMASVEIVEGGNAKTYADRMPFAGASASAGGETIVLMVGDSPGRHLMHAIGDAAKVIHDRSGLARGVGEALRIESASGTTTSIVFHAPAPSR